MRLRHGMLLAGCLAAGLLCRAAEPAVEPPATKTAVVTADGGKAKVEAQRPAGEAGSKTNAVEAWLRQLQSRNPEEFERLSKLRTENPAAFQKVLKDRLERMRESKLEDMPRVKAFMEKMTALEREQFLKRLHEGGGKLREEWARHNVSLDKCEQDARTLVAAYKAANGDDKKKVRSDLKKKVAETFELREKARQEVIQRMEGQLAKLKKDSEKRKSERDVIVEVRMKELLAEASASK
jgi:hypothetical protein